jgi:endonuclease YncB( thermonuclease family)
MNSIKRIGPVALVCFCALAWLKAVPVSAQCPLLSAPSMDHALPWSGQPLVGKTYKLHNWFVQDGDSLSLSEGHRLRLGHINTTEMASKGRPTQAYAEQGKAQLKQQLKQQPVIYVQLLPEVKDHYGRWLVKLYDGFGSNLEASLVAQGLAYVISMDDQGAPRCLWQQEVVARKQGLGLWQASMSRVRDATILTPRQGGFMRLGAVVTDISQSQRHWYIGLGGQVAVKIAKDMLAASRFRIDSAQQLEPWIGQNMTVRGWLAWRKLSKKQHKKGFKAGVMSLYHLHMLEQGPNLGSH